MEMTDAHAIDAERASHEAAAAAAALSCLLDRRGLLILAADDIVQRLVEALEGEGEPAEGGGAA